MEPALMKRGILKRSTEKYLEKALGKKLFEDGGEERKRRKQIKNLLESHRGDYYKSEVGMSFLRSLGSPFKLSETMEKGGMKKTVSDQAIHLDLVAKGRGISAAETYFINLPESSKMVPTIIQEMKACDNMPDIKEKMPSPFMKRGILERSTDKYLKKVLGKLFFEDGRKFFEDGGEFFEDGGEEPKLTKQINHFLQSRRKSDYQWEVGNSLERLRRRKLYGPALSETMEKRGMNKTVSNQAIHLDQIDLAKLMKAGGLIERSRDLTLYLKCGLPEMVPTIIQEMKACDIMPDICTYNVWMRALAAVKDIAGVERVIDEIKRDDRVAGDWTTYSNLASIYADAGLFDKAEKALKELESKNACRELSAYQSLITLYGRTKNLREVYRIWCSVKLAFPKISTAICRNMIQVLVNLNDLLGAEKCFKEWASGHKHYDISVANILIGAYLREGSFEKAEVLKKYSQRRGSKPKTKTWELYLDYYLKKGETKSVVDCVEKAISAGKGHWTPSPSIVQELMQHFEQNKDVKGAEAFLEVLKKAKDELGSEVFELLVRIYASAGKKSPIMRRRIMMENVELSEEGMKLLDDISNE